MGLLGRFERFYPIRAETVLVALHLGSAITITKLYLLVQADTHPRRAARNGFSMTEWTAETHILDHSLYADSYDPTFRKPRRRRPVERTVFGLRAAITVVVDRATRPLAFALEIDVRHVRPDIHGPLAHRIVRPTPGAPDYRVVWQPYRTN